MIPLAIRRSEENAKPASLPQQIIRFVLHQAAVYLTPWFVAPWIAGAIYDWILPRLGAVQVSRLEFLFSHVLALTFVPAFVAGLINARYRHRVALLVWVVPAIVLSYDMLTFSTSAFQDYWPAVFHYYFGGGFLVPQIRSYRDLFDIAGTFDMIRGIAQLHVTGAFYAGIGYSLAAFLSPRLRWQHSGETSNAEP